MATLRYYTPHPAVRPWISAYYYADLGPARTDYMRAESPNLRFVLSGGVSAPGRFRNDHFDGPCAILCGVTNRANPIQFTQGTRLFGIAFTPLGWHNCFGMPMTELANEIESFCHIEPQWSAVMLNRMLEATSDHALVAAADDLVQGLGAARSVKKAPPHDFINMVEDWLTNPQLAGLDAFFQKVDLSVRQTERLSCDLFGAPPKKMFRKFRALHASNALAWTNHHRWIDVAHPTFYDQSHFIRDFREFVGCSPREYIKGPNLLIRQNLMARLMVNHPSDFSRLG